VKDGAAPPAVEVQTPKRKSLVGEVPVLACGVRLEVPQQCLDCEHAALISLSGGGGMPRCVHGAGPDVAISLLEYPANPLDDDATARLSRGGWARFAR
jgi:hypothetical protein